jgi:hypothetical protein
VLVRLLFVEDVETDAELAVRRLRQDGVQCTCGAGCFAMLLENAGSQDTALRELHITVAEGVETRAQPNFLERAGCMQSQGFLHAQPMPAAALETLLTG